MHTNDAPGALTRLVDMNVEPYLVASSLEAVLAQRLVRAKIENQEQAVAALVTSDNPWLRSCGAYAIGMFGMRSLEGELNRCLNDTDPLLRETARAAKLLLEALVIKA